jgi:hypothetical protein
MGATGANGFPRQADQYGQAADDHARSRTDPDDAERRTGYLRDQKAGGSSPSERAGTQRKARGHIRQLEALGHTVTLTQAA